MLITTWLILVGITAGMILASILFVDAHYLGIAGSTLLLITGVVMLAQTTPLETTTGETRTINTTNASAPSPDRTVQVQDVRSEISPYISTGAQWITLLSGLAGTIIFTMQARTPSEEEGVFDQ